MSRNILDLSIKYKKDCVHYKHRMRTWGNETSEYPEEKKQICIPLVAASESGEAQIPHLLEISLKFPKGAGGCRTGSSLRGELQNFYLVEVSGKTCHRG